MKNFFLIGFFFIFSLYGSTKFTIFSVNGPIDSEKRERDIKKILMQEKENISNHLTIANISGKALGKCLDKDNIGKLNEMQIDITTIEPDQMQILKEEKNAEYSLAKFHFLASNFIDEKGNYFFGPNQTLIYDLEGIKIGFFALYPEEKNFTKKKIYFLPSSFIAKKMIKQLKAKNVDVIIVLSHQSLKKDKKLLQTLKNIDMIIGCHNKETISSYDDHTFIYKQKNEDKHLVRIDLSIEKKGPPHMTEIKVYPSWRDVKIE